MKKIFIKLDICKGSNEGLAIYLNTYYRDPEGNMTGTGSRVAGPKCWGYIKTQTSFPMSESDLEFLIAEAKSALNKLKKAPELETESP